MVIAEIKNLAVRIHTKVVLKNISFQICKGESYAITGPSASGKTTLLRALSENISYSGTIIKQRQVHIVLVEQQHKFKDLSNSNTFYYQQRFNASEADDAISVDGYLRQGYVAYQNGIDDASVKQYLRLLDVERLLKKRLIQLSNGENKRVQLVKALLTNPDILLLDNAFAGLDLEASTTLQSLLKAIMENGITIILVTSERMIPHFVTKVITLNTDGEASIILRKDAWMPTTNSTFKLDVDLLKKLTNNKEIQTFDYAVKMLNVNVNYHHKEILKNINWQVKRGEHWSVSGPNGAGKSTLLSLINADNPQAYANEIYLFDRRRGQGESIWDIKRKIGYVSPELHLYFDTSSTAFNVVASGLFDTIGLFKILTEEQAQNVLHWMKLLRIDCYSKLLLKTLSAGVQRLVLLARALIKNPPLLLLDEPAQGLSDDQSDLFKTVVEEICAHTDTTLIYITHNKNELPASVNKFIELKEGCIEQISHK